MSGAEKGSLELRDLLERRSTLEPGTTIDRDRLIRGSSCLLVSSGEGGSRLIRVSSCLLVSSGRGEVDTRVQLPSRLIWGDRVAFVPSGEGQKNYEWVFKEGLLKEEL